MMSAFFQRSGNPAWPRMCPRHSLPRETWWWLGWPCREARWSGKRGLVPHCTLCRIVEEWMDGGTGWRSLCIIIKTVDTEHLFDKLLQRWHPIMSKKFHKNNVFLWVITSLNVFSFEMDYHSTVPTSTCQCMCESNFVTCQGFLRLQNNWNCQHFFSWFKGIGSAKKPAPLWSQLEKKLCSLSLEPNLLN